MIGPSRYVGKPLLRLMECYVLRAIGALSQEDETTLAAMAPKLALLYQREGTWDTILAAQLELPSHLPSLIVATWQRNRDIAKAKGVALAPQQFAELFVDENFA